MPAPLTAADLLQELKSAPAKRGPGASIAMLLKVIAPGALKALLDWLAERYDIRPKGDDA